MALALSVALLATTYGTAWGIATVADSGRTGGLHPVETIRTADWFEITLFAAVAMNMVILGAFAIKAVVV